MMEISNVWVDLTDVSAKTKTLLPGNRQLTSTAVTEQDDDESSEGGSESSSDFSYRGSDDEDGDAADKREEKVRFLAARVDAS